MKLNILRGGSGKWQLRINGRNLACGHVPKQIEGQEFLNVVTRQIARFVNYGEYGEMNFPKLGGGYLYELEVSDSLINKLMEKEKSYREKIDNEDRTNAYRELRLAEFEELGFEVVRYRIEPFSIRATVVKDESYYDLRRESKLIVVIKGIDVETVILDSEKITTDPFGDTP